jgi:hypothetical protein
VRQTTVVRIRPDGTGDIVATGVYLANGTAILFIISGDAMG